MSREPPPPAWTTLASWLGMTPVQARTWWQALGDTPTHEATELRTAVLCHEVLPQTMSHKSLIHAVWAPKRLIASLESCIETGHLSRKEGTALEELVLRFTHKTGRWS